MKRMNKKITTYLHSLNQLQQLIFLPFIRRDYHENRFEYEKKMIMQTRIVMQEMTNIRKMLLPKEIISRLEHLYELLYSLDLLKYRLLDHATFEVCEAELKKLSEHISNILLTMRNDSSQIDLLQQSVGAFEILFENTLQFIVADPMYFLFFIQDLKMLNDELNLLINELQSLI